MSNKLYRIDNLLWEVSDNGTIFGYPICPKHNFPLDTPGDYDTDSSYIYSLHCELCDKEYEFPKGRSLRDQENYIEKMFRAKQYQKMEIIDFDGALTPVAKTKIKDSNFFVTAQVMDSKRGPQLVIYAGEKGHEEKVQMFVDPTNKKLSFDHKDIDPSDVFTEITATFKDGTSQKITGSE